MTDDDGRAGSPGTGAGASALLARWFVPTLAFAAAVALVVQGQALLLLFAGVLSALVFGGVARWIAARTPIPYRVAVVALVALVSVGTCAIVYFGGAALVAQAGALGDQVTTLGGPVLDRLRGNPVVRVVTGGRPPEAGVFLEKARGVVALGTEGMASFIVFFFLTVYGALSPGEYAPILLRLVPPSRRPRVARTLDDVADNLTRWLLGRAVAIAFVGVASTIALYALHVPLALLLGAVAGLLAFVEYVGAFAAAGPAMLLALPQGLGKAFAVGLVYFGIHVVEGYVLTPALTRSTVRFPPAFALAAQVLFSALYGVAGLTFATPLAVVVVIAIRDLYVEDVLGDVPSRPATEGKPLL